MLHDKTPEVSNDEPQSCFSRKIPLRLALVCLSFVIGCASSPSRPRADDKWEVTTRSPLDKLRSRPEPVTDLQAVTWKGIQPGHTKRADVESRFGKGIPLETRVAYRVDQISALIAYSGDGTVHAIRLPVAIQIDQQTIIAEYGKPTPDRKSDSLLVWDYDGAGVSVEFTQGKTGATAVELDTRSAMPDALSSGMGRELVPVRPPLTNLTERRGHVLDAMRLSGDTAYSLCTGETEETQSQQFLDQLTADSLLMTNSDLQIYLNGLLARLASVTPTRASEWKIAALSMEAPNALNLGGGTILLSSA
jgi:hypothetical protein